jgi:hypothetical protein
MESWNVYPQNTPNTPSSTWLCPQNNGPSSDWLHPNNNSTERERNENTAALATPTRYIMDYNDVNQNSSSSSFYSPYAQEMERLFENSFLKLGNPEDLLNNNLSSWLDNETVVPVTTTASNIVNNTSSNSPTPSLITDDDQDQLYNNSTYVTKNHKNQRREQQKIVTTTAPSTNSTTSSPVSHDEQQKIRYPMATSSTFYQPTFQDHQYLQAKKHDPKQLLLPLTTSKDSMDGTMTVTISSPTPSLEVDDDIDQYHQSKTKSRRQSYYQDFQLGISTDDLPIQQPSPSSSENSHSSDETTPKQKKRRVSHRKLNNSRSSKVHEDTLISPDESYSEQNLMTETTITATTITAESDESSLNVNTASATASSSSSSLSSSELTTNISEMTSKRSLSDDGREETPEEKRSRLLERNRIAAAKCRQKKKQAQESLQHQASELTQKNTTMHSLVNDLREEALKLKNQLLAHSTCNCNVIQEYVRTSGQFAFARPPFTK